MDITEAELEKQYYIVRVMAKEPIQSRLRSMGFMRGASLSVLYFTIRRQTYDVRIGDEEIALRVEEAKTIYIKEAEEAQDE